MAFLDDDIPTLPDGEITAGQVLGGRYRLTGKRAVWGEMALWTAWDDTLSRPVTVYILPPNHPRTDILLGAARQAGTATDPRFLRVLDMQEFGPSEPVSFIVCESLPGVSLRTLLTRGPLPNLDAAWVACELAAALAPLHDLGLTHGVLNPATVLVTTKGAVRITGFLLDAALAGRDRVSAATRERDDVEAVGQILYAALVGAWPDMSRSIPPKTFGLPVAQWQEDRLLPPTALRPGVAPLLDSICLQTLQPVPDRAPLRTAAAIAIALRRVLGTADASSDLASRVAAHGSDFVTAEPADDPAMVDPLLEGAQDTTQVVDGRAKPVTSLAAATKTNPPAEPALAQPSIVAEPTESRDDSPPTKTSKTTRPKFSLPWLKSTSWRHPSPWLWVVPALATVLAVFLIVRSCAISQTEQIKPLTVTAINELDAKADGGDGKDNPDLVPLATDGFVDTCWESEVYTDDYIPFEKPGIGLILDFGQDTSVQTLTVTTDTGKTSLLVMVPGDLSSPLEEPPLKTVKNWQSLVEVSVTESPQTIVLPTDSVSRFFMLYFIELAPVADKAGFVQARVCEVTATG